MAGQFEDFVRDVEPRLRRALCAARGPQAGRDATAHALAYAWEHWDEVRRMRNPAGYLYRVGQSAARVRRVPLLPAPDATVLPDVEPGLPDALASLSEQQRVVVLLVHAEQWRPTEVAELLEISVSTVRNHLSRGMAKLREALEVRA